MNISLTPELQKFVEDQLHSGLYHSASEVIRDGLRLLIRFNEQSLEYKAWLNEQISLGLAQLDHGEFSSSESLRDRVVAKARQNLKKSA